jgi:epoxyqueuosine reductase QueG
MNRVFQKILTFLAEHNISTYGVAPSSAMETEPAGYRPSDLLPGSQSLFCAGIAIPGGVFRAGPRDKTTYWRTANVIYRYLDAILVRCAAIMEEDGELAVPVFGCFPYEVKGKGDLWGYLNLVKMAEVSGLGKLGRSGMLINSKVGPRLLLGGIVTTAGLPITTSSIGKQTECPEDCFACQDACPVKAIDRNGKVDRLKCIRFSIRSPLFLHLLKSGEVIDAEMEMVNQVSGVDDHSMYNCIACVAACPRGCGASPEPRGTEGVYTLNEFKEI